MTKAPSLFERVTAALAEVEMPYEADEGAASFAVHPAPGATAVLDFEVLPDDSAILFAELVLLEHTTDDWSAALPLSRWSAEHPFIKFCRYDDGRLTVRAELLSSHVDPLELAVTLWALYNAVALTDEARTHVGGEPAQAAWDPDAATDHLSVMPSVPADELLPRVRAYLTESGLSFDERGGAFAVSMPGGTELVVLLSEDGRLVSLGAIIAADIDPRNLGASQLLSVNRKIGFGALSVDAQDRAVVIQHELVAATLDREELVSAAQYMATAIAGFGNYFAEALDPSVGEAVRAAKRFVDDGDEPATGEADAEPVDGVPREPQDSWQRDRRQDLADAQARGRAVLEFAHAQWPEHIAEAYEPPLEVLKDVAHAVLPDVPPAQLAGAIARLLGTAAADLIVERALMTGAYAEDSDVQVLIRETVEAMRKRHWGDPDDY